MLVFAVLSSHMRTPGPSFHDTVLIQGPAALMFEPAVMPNPMSPGKYMAICTEGPSTMRWLNPLQHKLTHDVEFDGWNVAQEKHDVGAGIPHFTVVPDAMLVPMAMTFSKYKVLFSAAAIKVDGKPVGTYYPVMAPPLFCTAPISMPAAIPTIHNIVPWPCTVRVGMTPGDFASGWESVAGEQITDTLWSVIFGNFPWPKEIKDLFGKWGEELFEKLGLEGLKQIGKKLGEDLLKKNVFFFPKQKIELPFGLGSWEFKDGQLKFLGKKVGNTPPLVDTPQPAPPPKSSGAPPPGADPTRLGPAIVLPEGTPHID